ncbi:MAG: hypothetical protein HC876_20065, partial [Chloroflexaceae bacterium]|nr:hypothetical protein [Chloroflexaceae bacterium]
VTIAEDSVLFIVPATADTSALPPESVRMYAIRLLFWRRSRTAPAALFRLTR